jgi:hypothetical protein
MCEAPSNVKRMPEIAKWLECNLLFKTCHFGRPLSAWCRPQSVVWRDRRVNVRQSAWCNTALIYREFGVNDELQHLGMPSDNGLKDLRVTFCNRLRCYSVSYGHNTLRLLKYTVWSLNY